jgi:glycosyltransferase involved in cell wall biosynthesis
LITESSNPADRYPIFWLSDVCLSFPKEEVFPLTILEAMAFKKAVIAETNSAASHVVEDWENGFLISRNDSVELANKLTEMVQKMDLTEDFGRRSHEIAMDHYHIKKSGAKLEQYLRESIVY